MILAAKTNTMYKYRSSKQDDYRVLHYQLDSSLQKTSQRAHTVHGGASWWHRSPLDCVPLNKKRDTQKTKGRCIAASLLPIENLRSRQPDLASFRPLSRTPHMVRIFSHDLGMTEIVQDSIREGGFSTCLFTHLQFTVNHDGIWVGILLALPLIIHYDSTTTHWCDDDATRDDPSVTQSRHSNPG